MNDHVKEIIKERKRERGDKALRAMAGCFFFFIAFIVCATLFGVWVKFFWLGWVVTP